MGKCAFLEHMYGWVFVGVTVSSTFMNKHEWAWLFKAHLLRVGVPF